VTLLLSSFTVLTPSFDFFDRLPQLITRALPLVGVQAVLCLLQLRSESGDRRNSEIDSWRLFQYGKHCGATADAHFFCHAACLMLAGDFASGPDGVFLIVVFDNGMDVRSVLKVYHFPLVLFVTGIVRVGHDFCSSVFPLVSQMWLW
jgi:hypothetical protein